MSKVVKDSENIPQAVVYAIVAIVMILFTAFGFFVEQPCDIDRVYLWCRLHPFSVGDAIGTGLFYLSCIFLSGVWKNFFTIYEEPNKTTANIVAFIVALLSVVLIWNT